MMNRHRLYSLAALASLARMANESASGFPTTAAYRHARKRQQIARASRKANR